MKGMKKELSLVASGVLLGAALAAPAATAALTAQLSNQRFVVNGKPAQIEAYSICGSNYVRLRDVGRAANFSVTFDPQTNTVHIATGEPYAEETARGRVVTLPNDGSKYTPQVGDLIPWSGMTTRQYKDLKRLKKENLRDNMSDTELVLTMLAEASTRDISRAEKPEGFTESKRVAKRGGSVAKVAREALEAETGQPVITAQNAAQMGTVVTELIEAVASEDEEK